MTTTTPFLDRLAATPPAQRADVLEALVVGEFRTWLLLEDTDPFPLDVSYFEQGLTSLGATEIKQRLEGELGRPVDAATLFNNPTAGNLLAHLRGEVLADLFGAAPAAAPEPEQRTAEQDLMDDLLRDLYSA